MGALWARRHLQGPWSLGLRPEFYWDPDGLITGAKQLIWDLTGTLEYRVRVVSKHTVTAKLESRFDRSTGRAAVARGRGETRTDRWLG